MLSRYEGQGFTHYREEWEALDAYRGQTVVLHMGERTLAGTTAGVDETGAIKLETPTGVQCFSGGEISVRVAS